MPVLGTSAGGGAGLHTDLPELGHELALTITRADSPDLAIADVLRTVCERTGWALGQAWLRSADGRTLECSPAWHASAPGLESFRRVTEALSFLPGIGLPGNAWELREPVWMRDVKLDRGFERGLFAQDAGLGAGLAVPVPARDEIAGGHRVLPVGGAGGGRTPRGARVRRRPPSSALLFQEQQARGGAARERGALPRRGRRCRGRDPVARPPRQDHLRERGGVAHLRPGARELAGRPVTDVLPAECPQRTSTGPAGSWRSPGSRHDGEAAVAVPLEARVSRWSAGGQTFTTAVLRDITTRSRDEAAVHEAEERFRGAFEEAPIGMALVSIESDRAGCFLRVNRALCEIIGYSPEDLVGTGFETIVDPSDEDSSDSRYVPWMLAGEVRSFEVEKRLRRADGETIVAMVAVSLVPDAHQRPLYLIVQLQDVTARTRAEAALVESRERVQAIIDNTAAVIYVKDMEGRYTLVNRSFETLFGVEPRAGHRSHRRRAVPT